MAVVVVFGRSLDAVAPWPALVAALRRKHDSGACLQRVLIYDNSPAPCARPDPDLSRCTYIHDSSNGGTAAAYVAAAEIACANGIGWLLLLDQDTTLTQSYIDAVHAALAAMPVTSVPPDPQVQLHSATPGAVPAALLPRVYHGTQLISPARVTGFGSIAPLLTPPDARLARLTALSSGMVLNVERFNALLPLPDALWLDYVDHWICARLNMHAAAMLVLDQRLQHDLSVAKLASLSEQRLFSILAGEACFQSLLGIKARIVYPLRMAARIIRYAFLQPRLALATMAWISRRIRSHA